MMYILHWRGWGAATTTAAAAAVAADVTPAHTKVNVPSLSTQPVKH